MTSFDAQTARRALEALRNGVPNTDAVKVLGCAQPAVLERFEQQLTDIENGTPAKGQLIAGDFGSGKSHLLTHLRARALQRGFVCSTVVISKETPLFDPSKVVRSMLAGAEMPKLTGHVAHELPTRVTDGPRRDELLHWAAAEAHPFIGATVHLYWRSEDEALKNEIAEFWGGERLSVSAVKSGLKQLGLQKAFTVSAIKQKNIGVHRLDLLVRLARAAAMNGWVVLIDEVELIGRYSANQRGRSYAELARWLGNSPRGYAGVTTVATITDDYDVAVLAPKGPRGSGGKGDAANVPALLRKKGTDEFVAAAEDAETAIASIQRDARQLARPTVDTLRVSHDTLRRVHALAYGWEPAELALPPQIAASDRLRTFVRRWIAEWDIRRLYPDARPTIDVDAVTRSYDEDEALQTTSDENERDV